MLARKLLKTKSKKQNGFTLIELMVVVAIVGILTAVGLPELSKAQDRAKDATAVSTLTNAAKECSLSLILNDNADDYGKQDPNPFKDVQGTCAKDETLTLASDAGGNASVKFAGNIPGTVTPPGEEGAIAEEPEEPVVE